MTASTLAPLAAPVTRTPTPTATAVVTGSGGGSRAARLRLPRSVQVVKDLAVEHGVCIRPITLRRTDLETGRTEVVDLPCGSTRADRCPSCARRARSLRMQQIREGWHREDEPIPAPDPATDDQIGLIVLRAHLEFERAQVLIRPMSAEQRAAELAEIDAEIEALEEEIMLSGLRGRTAPPHDREQGDREGKRRIRSTRRRQDAPDLPRLPVAARTVGRTYTAPDGKVYRPSLFVTLTLPSYGRVRSDDGTPVDPDTYDYRRAAWDAVHFPRLLDRFWQNLRRACGWNVQYAGSVEPQRRLAPHAHFAVRGTIPRSLIKRVAAATYHQVWWPRVDTLRYTLDRPPVWSEQTGGFVDPDTGAALATWAEALDEIDADPTAEPVHVARFGQQVHVQGVTAGSPDAERAVRYITKYITKQASDCHEITSDRQRAHLERLWAELRVTPCSAKCPNWLLYGVQPDRAHARMVPGRCRGRVHQRATLGLGGRRVLVSRQWSGKSLADHRADRRAWVRTLLGRTSDDQEQEQTSRYAWELARPDDPDVLPLGHRLLRAISERIQQRAQLEAARRRATSLSGGGEISATGKERS